MAAALLMLTIVNKPGLMALGHNKPKLAKHGHLKKNLFKSKKERTGFGNVNARC